MRVAIVGSRSINDKQVVYKAIKEAFDEIEIDDEKYAPARRQGLVIISGGAQGVDSLVRSFAIESGHDFIMFEPYFKLDEKADYSPRHFFTRNRQIVRNCDILIAIWDGESTGTAQTINYAKKLNKIVVVKELQKPSEKILEAAKRLDKEGYEQHNQIPG